MNPHTNLIHDLLERLLQSDRSITRYAIEPTGGVLRPTPVIPDLIVWRGQDLTNGVSVYDVKRSIDDCRAHLRKPHVSGENDRNGKRQLGIGCQRYIVTDDSFDGHPVVHDAWGHIEINAVGMVEHQPATVFARWQRDLWIEYGAYVAGQDVGEQAGQPAKPKRGKIGDEIIENDIKLPATVGFVAKILRRKSSEIGKAIRQDKRFDIDALGNIYPYESE